MPKKRKNGGRTGSQKGRDQSVQCTHCGRMVPRTKAKRVTRRLRYIEPVIAKELRKAGTVIHDDFQQDWACISCAIHSHKIKIRSKDDRHVKGRI